MEALGIMATQEMSHATSASKIMRSIFWDAKGILLIDYTAHKTTISEKYNASLVQ